MPKRKRDSKSSLVTMSRSIVNRNVNIENIDSLPLPRSLKDECFVNNPLDRCKEFVPRQSVDPCIGGCCNFPTSEDFKQCRLVHLIPQWSRRSKSMYDLHLFYSPILPKVSTDAEWVNLPDSETLLKRYRESSFGKQILEACLNPLRFDSSTGLGQAHEWIRRFLYYRDTHGWYHVSVQAGRFSHFLENMKNVPIVVLPYGCISENGYDATQDSEDDCLRHHLRQMIVVVKNDDCAYKQALRKFKNETLQTLNLWFIRNNFKNKKICTIEQFINTIAYVSRPRLPSPYPNGTDRHYIIFNPIIRHAMWWMLLLVPKGCLNNFTELNVYKKENREYKEKYYASQELEIENCVVQFDPLYQCIGYDVKDLKKHVEGNKPFVYWLRGRILNVTEIKNVPSFITCSENPKQTFVEWCVSREMNCLLNLNGDCWVRYKIPKRDEWMPENDDYMTTDEENNVSPSSDEEETQSDILFRYLFENSSDEETYSGSDEETYSGSDEETYSESDGSGLFGRSVNSIHDTSSKDLSKETKFVQSRYNLRSKNYH